MSEPKPRRTRAKAAGAVVVLDSHASPGIEPEAQRGQTLSHQAASDAQRADSDAAIEPSPEAIERARQMRLPQPQPARFQRSTPKETQPAGQTAETAKPPSETDAGNVPDATAGSDSKPFNHAHVRTRLQQHPDWKRIITTVREMRLDPKIPPKGRERFIWGEMDRLYPVKHLETASNNPIIGQLEAQTQQVVTATPLTEKTGVKGLGDIPPGWPPLPANAPLSAELGWVQANRLYVVDELPSGGTRVHLDRAHEPAPSRAAIGWLETSIRSYAKYVEVCAKVTSSGADEGEDMKRERMAIDEIRGLLAEMAGNPPGPGR